MTNDEILKINKHKILQILKQTGFETLADYIETWALNNPYEIGTLSHQMWYEQCYVNFPILYLASVYLYLYGHEKRYDNYLFVTRDCCHWHRIFSKLFPETTVHYFHSSRNIFEQAMKGNHPYDDYVKSLVGETIDRCIFIDVHGTGQRVLEYCREKYNEFPFYFLLTVSPDKFSDLPAVTRDNADKFMSILYGTRGSPIEMLNYDLIGTLQGYDENGPIRDDLEYDKNLVRIYHHVMYKLIKNLPAVQFGQH